MGSTETFAVVRTRFEALHQWDDALNEVDFLRDSHRHEFHVKVKVEQFHDDRDVEYIMLKRALDDYLAQWDRDQGQQSCEMMCKRILNEFLFLGYGDQRKYVVSVTEDGENGAEVTYSDE